jgi:hypothetical protein
MSLRTINVDRKDRLYRNARKEPCLGHSLGLYMIIEYRTNGRKKRDNRARFFSHVALHAANILHVYYIMEMISVCSCTQTAGIKLN